MIGICQQTKNWPYLKKWPFFILNIKIIGLNTIKWPYLCQMAKIPKNKGAKLSGSIKVFFVIGPLANFLTLTFERLVIVFTLACFVRPSFTLSDT